MTMLLTIALTDRDIEKVASFTSVTDITLTLTAATITSTVGRAEGGGTVVEKSGTRAATILAALAIEGLSALAHRVAFRVSSTSTALTAVVLTALITRLTAPALCADALAIETLATLVAVLIADLGRA
jgi:hypothetical protein